MLKLTALLPEGKGFFKTLSKYLILDLRHEILTSKQSATADRGIFSIKDKKLSAFSSSEIHP